jgi:hypothetical protein
LAVDHMRHPVTSRSGNDPANRDLEIFRVPYRPPVM